MDQPTRADDSIETRMKIEIRDIGIPPRPTILAQIEAETAKDEPDFIFLAKLLGKDVGLSAGMIKVANSPYFSLGKKVPTIQEALLVLGLDGKLGAFDAALLTVLMVAYTVFLIVQSRRASAKNRIQCRCCAWSKTPARFFSVSPMYFDTTIDRSMR